MFPRLYTFLLALAALVLALVGLLSIITPFLPLDFSGYSPPSGQWTTSTFVGIGIASIAIGVWLWVLAWNHWLPKEDGSHATPR